MFEPVVIEAMDQPSINIYIYLEREREREGIVDMVVRGLIIDPHIRMCFVFVFEGCLMPMAHHQ